MIVVTGGAGFIGSAVVWGLNRRGVDDILVVDQLGRDEKWQNLRGLSVADYVDKDAFLEMAQDDALPREAQAIIHMGACSTTTERDADYLLRNNFAYTRELARAAARRGLRFIYASSAATYGDGSHGYIDDEARLDELRPLNLYGYSKHLFDLYARRQGWLKQITGLKFANVFGPNEYHKGDMRSMVVKAFEQIREQGSVRLFRSYRGGIADGDQRRDFLYVKDAVDIVLFGLDHPEVTGIYNAGSGKTRTWTDLAVAVFRALERPTHIEYIDMPEALRGQYQYFTELPMDKLRGVGYVRPFTGLEDGVRDYVRNYLLPGKGLDAREPHTS